MHVITFYIHAPNFFFIFQYVLSIWNVVLNIAHCAFELQHSSRYSFGAIPTSSKSVIRYLIVCWADMVNTITEVTVEINSIFAFTLK